jgi:hypothetical protein
MNARRGLDWDDEWRFTAEELRLGAERQIVDEWRFPCEACGGTAVSRNRPCEPCGGNGFVSRTYRKRRILVIPAGSRPGRKIRLCGWGYHGDPDVPGNRGDRLITLRLYGDGEVLDELPPYRAPEPEVPSLPPAGTPGNRLTGGS